MSRRPLSAAESEARRLLRGRNIDSLRPPAELFADKPHGTRGRYMAGCKCPPCKRANSQYECDRQRARKAGDWNGIVPAAAAREHLKKLSKQGVGRRTVHACTDVADTVLSEIISGVKVNIRARTERLILGVTKEQAADRALTSAGKAQKLLADLKEEGYTKRFLAKKLGYSSNVPQLGKKRITVRNAARVERLHKELTT